MFARWTFPYFQWFCKLFGTINYWICNFSSSAQGNELQIRQADLYLRDREELSFYEIILRARQRREIVIGYRLANAERAVINPPSKSNRQRWSVKDVFVVIAEKEWVNLQNHPRQKERFGIPSKMRECFGCGFINISYGKHALMIIEKPENQRKKKILEKPFEVFSTTIFPFRCQYGSHWYIFFRFTFPSDALI